MERISIRIEGAGTLEGNGRPVPLQGQGVSQSLERTYDAREIAAEWYGGLMLVVAVLLLLLLWEAIQHLQGR